MNEFSLTNGREFHIANAHRAGDPSLRFKLQGSAIVSVTAATNRADGTAIRRFTQADGIGEIHFNVGKVADEDVTRWELAWLTSKEDPSICFEFNHTFWHVLQLIFDLSFNFALL